MPPRKLVLTPGRTAYWNSNKYQARRVRLDGYWFDSKAEAKRYEELKLRVKAGQITGLTVHPVYPLVINGVSVGRYTPDFRYTENGLTKIEDVKNELTKYISSFRIKVFQALYGLKVEYIMPNRRPKKWAEMARMAKKKNEMEAMRRGRKKSKPSPPQSVTQSSEDSPQTDCETPEPQV